MQSRNWGFTIGQIIETSLLISLFLSWDGMVDHTFTIEKISTSIRPMFDKMYKQILGSKNIKQILNNHKKPVACAFSHQMFYNTLLTNKPHMTQHSQTWMPRNQYIV
jgi:hypothetical protein